MDSGEFIELKDPNEDNDPSEQEIEEYAQWLGADLENDRDLFWIAREALTVKLPPGWKVYRKKDGTSDPFYFNIKTGESLWDHPLDQHFKEMFEAEKAKKEAAKNEPANKRPSAALGSFSDRVSDADTTITQNLAPTSLSVTDNNHSSDEDLERMIIEHEEEKKKLIESFEKEIVDLKSSHEAQMNDLRMKQEQERDNVNKEIQNLQKLLRENQAKIDEERTKFVKEIEELKEQNKKEIEMEKAKHLNDIASIRQEVQMNEINSINEQHDQAVEKEKNRLKAELENLKSQGSAEISMLKKENDENIVKEKRKHDEEIQRMELEFNKKKNEIEEKLKELLSQEESIKEKKSKLSNDLKDIQRSIDAEAIISKYEKEIEQLKEENDEILKKNSKLEKQIRVAKKKHEEEVKEIKGEYNSEIKLLKQQHLDEINEIKQRNIQNNDNQLKSLRLSLEVKKQSIQDEFAEEIELIKLQHEQEIAKLKRQQMKKVSAAKVSEDNEAEIQKLMEEFNQQKEELNTQNQEEIDQMTLKHKRNIARIKKKQQSEIQKLQDDHEEEMERLTEEQKESMERQKLKFQKQIEKENKSTEHQLELIRTRLEQGKLRIEAHINDSYLRKAEREAKLYLTKFYTINFSQSPRGKVYLAISLPFSHNSYTSNNYMVYSDKIIFNSYPRQMNPTQQQPIIISQSIPTNIPSHRLAEIPQFSNPQDIQDQTVNDRITKQKQKLSKASDQFDTACTDLSNNMSVNYQEVNSLINNYKTYISDQSREISKLSLEMQQQTTNMNRTLGQTLSQMESKLRDMMTSVPNTVVPFAPPIIHSNQILRPRHRIHIDDDSNLDDDLNWVYETNVRRRNYD